jgi:cation transport regulator ChaC
MIRYFAYGSNMDRAQMARRCSGAVPLAKAKLDNWRFLITTAGFASMAPEPGAAVHGVLWFLTPRDLAALNAYECVDSGLYFRRTLPVRHAGRLRPALVYIGHTSRPGRPRPGYQGIVMGAAQDWELPPSYLDMLERLLPWRGVGARTPRTGETR